MKDVSVKKFETFVLLDSMWDGLSFTDVCYRLRLLAEYFNRMAGYRLTTLLAIAWNRRFSEIYKDKNFKKFSRAVTRINKDVRTPSGAVGVTDAMVYDQFELAFTVQNEEKNSKTFFVRPEPVMARRSMPVESNIFKPEIYKPEAKNPSKHLSNEQDVQDDIDTALERFRKNPLQNTSI